ncbi:chaperone protein dnaJ C76, chloroplastic isoform X1 [Ricinus communis]|uniref:chaperone protein dnaJ C76, chloroplastic isoform X1 n=1 Tax=Ricinus communis TaxID=3988 RepID=UPI00201B0AC3|nr:chaperone protein dnaJ C76, chloroplastic isoform X1 [Ricinus communis]
MKGMSLSIVSVYYPFSLPKLSQFHGCFNPNNTCSRWRQKCPRIRCCIRQTASTRTDKNYYELLGVSVDSDVKGIKEAYRKLQKKYHPDIAGQQGHEYTLMLNEAYKILMREDLRREYDISIGQYGKNNNVVMGFSSWRGPFRSQALFVDENACIGCRECVHNACNTFVMDEANGSARVKVQFGDDDQQIQVSVDSCPVNCIHWVDTEELAVLEFLNQPKLKEGYGVFGQGWERPTNVFVAAKSFSKQLKQQPDYFQSNARSTVEEETPAQAEARANASMKIKMERFSEIWNLVKKTFWFKHEE